MNILARSKTKVMSAIAAVSVLVSMLTGCTDPFRNLPLSSPVSVSDFKLNTYVEIRGYDRSASPDILRSALELCDRYENIFSRTIEDSELSRLNRSGSCVISPQLGELISTGIKYGDMSEGNFDISIGAVSSLWDFTSADPAIPDDDSVAAAVGSVDYRKIRLEKNPDGTYTASIPEDMTIDLGACAKGYIADRIKEFLIENGVGSALINLGGNVLCIGSKPDNAPYTVNIRRPFGESSDSLCSLSLKDMSVVTSGTYERCFTYNGRFYHHMLDPRTGYPYDNDLDQVTVISGDSVSGDCLSTVCYTLGLKRGLELINSLEDVWAVFVTKDGAAHYSSGAERFIKK